MYQKEIIDRMIRVDHAGEYGAKRIYEGQMAVMQGTSSFATIRHMYEQELEHLSYFEGEIQARQVRPTAAMPVWHVLGFTLGAVSALLGEKGAMACTVAVEEVIDEHYRKQLSTLENIKEESLVYNIEKFRQEELEHRDIGVEREAEELPGYHVFKDIVQGASKLAIWVSERF